MKVIIVSVTLISFFSVGFVAAGTILQGGDTVEDAVIIENIPYTDDGTTEGYNDDYDETCPYPGNSSPDVVYSFSAPADMVVTISTCEGSEYDTKMFVYENEVTPGNPYACVDDACPGYLSEIVDLPLTGGYTYYIIVCGYQDDAGYYTFDVFERQTSIDDDSHLVPNNLILAQNYPNPFNAQTTIRYSLLKPSDVTIEIYDILGRKIEVVIESDKPAGEHQQIWNAENHTSGIYLYRVQAGEFSETKKMVLLK